MSKKMCEEACRIIAKEIENFEFDTAQIEAERKALVKKLLSAQSINQFDATQEMILGVMSDINDNKKFQQLLKVIYKENCVPQNKWGTNGVASCRLENILTSILPVQRRIQHARNTRKNKVEK